MNWKILGNWKGVTRSRVTGVLLIVALVAGVQADDGVVLAIRSAADVNPQVASKRAELKSLGFRVDEAKAARLPSFSVEARTLDEGSSRGLLRLQQPLWAFGRIDGAIDLAGERERVARLELLDLRRRLIEDTAATYANLYGARRRLVMAEESIRQLERLAEMIARRQEGGVASEADVRLAVSRLAQAKLLRQQLVSQIERLQTDLMALSKQHLAGELAVPDSLVALPSPAAMIDSLELHFAGIRVREARLSVVRAEGALRKSELMPTISVRVDQDIAPRSTSTVDPLRYGVVLEGRLEGGGLVGMRRLEAEAARIRGAEEDLEAVRIEARQRIDRLLSDRNLQGDILTTQKSVVASIRESLESFVRQYDAGRKSWIDVLNTQRELSEALQQQEAARAAWADASLRIAALLGMLDEVAGVEP